MAKQKIQVYSIIRDDLFDDGTENGAKVLTEINVLGRNKKEVQKAMDTKDWFLQYNAPSGDGWAGAEFKIEDIYDPNEYELKTLTKVWELV